MDRNLDIQKVFEVADDSLQGVLGYHLYIIAMQKSVDVKKIWEYLPDTAIPHTFSWNRYYQKQDLTDTLTPIFEYYQSRISLIAMVNVFEVALGNFIYHLDQNGHPQTLNGKKLKGKDEKYKPCIKWAYLEVRKCDIGDEKAIKRLPKTFGKIDNARRFRNLIVHNHGLFTKRYEEDAINVMDIEIELHPDYAKFKKNPQIPIPIKLTTKDIIDFSSSHIEVLHILHNSTQKNFFGFSEAYDYRKEQKRIEWDKALWGI